MRYENIFVENNKKLVKMADDDDDDDFSNSVKMFNKPKTVNEVDAYIDGPIRQPYYYRNMLQYLRQMEPEDCCRIWINTYGGSFDSTQDIIGAMQQSEGSVVVIISGRAHSGGSMIALSAPQLIVSDKANMMIHTASFGTGGKLGDVFNHVEFTKKQIEQTIRSCYEGFLSQKELEDVFEGKEMWFNSEQIITRLKSRAEYQKNLEKVALNETKAPVPVKSKTKSKV